MGALLVVLRGAAFNDGGTLTAAAVSGLMLPPEESTPEHIKDVRHQLGSMYITILVPGANVDQAASNHSRFAASWAACSSSKPVEVGFS